MDYSDDWEKQQRIEEGVQHLDAMEEAMKVKHQRDAAMEQAKFTEQAFNEALQQMGISQNDWNQMITENPEAARKAFKRGVQKYVGKVASKNKRGNQRAAQSDGQAASPEKLSKLQQAASSGRVDSDTYLRGVIDAVLPADDPIWRI